MKKATVLIVDDHRAIIEGVKSSLTTHSDFEVIGECADGQTALNLVKTKKPDLVILDISIPNVDGVEVARQIQKLGLKARVVIYTMHSDSQFVIDLFKYGISAYVLKEDPLADLIRALEAVRAGGTYFSQIAPTVLAKRLEDLECWKANNHGISSLSDREREVFLLLAQGETIKKIAFQLNMSPKTVESHIQTAPRYDQINGRLGANRTFYNGSATSFLWSYGSYNLENYAHSKRFGGKLVWYRRYTHPLGMSRKPGKRS